MLRRIVLALLLLLGVAAGARGQSTSSNVGNTQTVRFTGAPSGACLPNQIGINNSNNDTYVCSASTLMWVKIASGGGGGVTNVVGPAFNVLNPTYAGSAVPDWRTVADGVCANASVNFSSATLALTQADVGKTFWVRPAVNQTTILTSAGTGALSQFVVATVTDATHWTSTNATGSGCSSSMQIAMGTDMSTAINNAVAAAQAATRGIVFVPCGEYAIAAPILATLSTTTNAITFEGGGMAATTGGISQACTRLHISPGIGWTASATISNIQANFAMKEIAFDGDNMTVPAVANGAFIKWSEVVSIQDVSFLNFYAGASSQVLCGQNSDDWLSIRLTCFFSGAAAFQFHSLNSVLLNNVFMGTPAALLSDWGGSSLFSGGVLAALGNGNALLADGGSGGGVGGSFIGTTFTGGGTNTTPIISLTNSNVNIRLVNPLFNNAGTSNQNLMTLSAAGSIAISGMTTRGAGTNMTITNTSGTILDGCTNNMAGVTSTGPILGTCGGGTGISKLCAANGTAASPSVISCGNSNTGWFSCATNAVTTCTVNTTGLNGSTGAVIVKQDNSIGGGLGITCNTTLNPPLVASRSSGTSFSITIAQPIVNPACYTYTLE